MCCNTCKKVLPTLFILIALVLAFLITFMHQNATVMGIIVTISRFFDIMIPVLAVGALVKYITCNSSYNNSCTCSYPKQENETTVETK